MSDLMDEETIWADESSPLLDEYGYDETVFGASGFTDELGDEAGEHDLACALVSEAEPLDEAAPAGFADEEPQPLTETAAEGAYGTEFPQQEWRESATEQDSAVSEIAWEKQDPGLLAAVMESGLSSEHTSTHDELPGSEHFDGPEHKDLGDRAAGPVQTVIMYGEPPQALSFGDVVALAGDYYGDYFELAELGRTAEGRRQIAWARWRCLGLDSDGVAAPPATDKQKKAVRDRYFVLAASNVSHFSAGGSAYLTYTQGHAGALVDALEAGLTANDVIWRRALTKEAFADHFLTDSFSAGHVRTPRAEIRQWYSQHMPTSADALIRYMARFIFDRLDERQQLPPVAWWYSWILRLWGTELLEGDVRRLGGEAVSVFTLGELVSLALHNHDNKGLDVVSNVDSDGHTVPGGYHWRAIGDNHLGIKRDAKPRPHAGSQLCPPPQFSRPAR